MPGYGQFCSVARAHEVLGGRWTLLIVREIMCGSRRFNDIRRGVPRVSRTVLSERLQELVLVGALARTDGPHGPEYELTDAGKELATLVSALATWGQRWLRRQPSREDLDLEPVLIDMQRRVCFAELPSQPLVVRFEIAAIPGATCFSRRTKRPFAKAILDFPSRSACADRWPLWLAGGAAT